MKGRPQFFPRTKNFSLCDLCELCGEKKSSNSVYENCDIDG